MYFSKYQGYDTVNPPHNPVFTVVNNEDLENQSESLDNQKEHSNNNVDTDERCMFRRFKKKVNYKIKMITFTLISLLCVAIILFYSFFSNTSIAPRQIDVFFEEDSQRIKVQALIDVSTGYPLTKFLLDDTKCIIKYNEMSTLSSLTIPPNGMTNYGDKYKLNFYVDVDLSGAKSMVGNHISNTYKKVQDDTYNVTSNIIMQYKCRGKLKILFLDYELHDMGFSREGHVDFNPSLYSSFTEDDDLKQRESDVAAITSITNQINLFNTNDENFNASINAAYPYMRPFLKAFRTPSKSKSISSLDLSSLTNGMNNLVGYFNGANKMDLSVSYNAYLMESMEKLVIHVPQMVFDLKVGSRLKKTSSASKYNTAGWQFQVPRQDVTFIQDHFVSISDSKPCFLQSLHCFEPSLDFVGHKIFQNANDSNFRSRFEDGVELLENKIKKSISNTLNLEYHESCSLYDFPITARKIADGMNDNFANMVHLTWGPSTNIKTSSSPEFTISEDQKLTFLHYLLGDIDLSLNDENFISTTTTSQFESPNRKLMHDEDYSIRPIDFDSGSCYQMSVVQGAIMKGDDVPLQDDKNTPRTICVLMNLMDGGITTFAGSNVVLTDTLYNLNPELEESLRWKVFQSDSFPWWINELRFQAFKFDDDTQSSFFESDSVKPFALDLRMNENAFFLYDSDEATFTPYDIDFRVSYMEDFNPAMDRVGIDLDHLHGKFNPNWTVEAHTSLSMSFDKIRLQLDSQIVVHDYIDNDESIIWDFYMRLVGLEDFEVPGYALYLNSLVDMRVIVNGDAAIDQRYGVQMTSHEFMRDGLKYHEMNLKGIDSESADDDAAMDVKLSNTNVNGRISYNEVNLDDTQMKAIFDLSFDVFGLKIDFNFSVEHQFVENDPDSQAKTFITLNPFGIGSINLNCNFLKMNIDDGKIEVKMNEGIIMHKDFTENLLVNWILDFDPDNSAYDMTQLLVIELVDHGVFIMDVPFPGFEWTEDHIRVEFDSIIHAIGHDELYNKIGTSSYPFALIYTTGYWSVLNNSHPTLDWIFDFRTSLKWVLDFNPDNSAYDVTQLLVVEQHDQLVFIMDVAFPGFKWTEDYIRVEFDYIMKTINHDELYNLIGTSSNPFSIPFALNYHTGDWRRYDFITADMNQLFHFNFVVYNENFPEALDVTFGLTTFDTIFTQPGNIASFHIHIDYNFDDLVYVTAFDYKFTDAEVKSIYVPLLSLTTDNMNIITSDRLVFVWHLNWYPDDPFIHQHLSWNISSLDDPNILILLSDVWCPRFTDDNEDIGWSGVWYECHPTLEVSSSDLNFNEGFKFIWKVNSNRYYDNMLYGENMFHNSLDLSHRYMHYSYNLSLKDSISYGTRTDTYVMTFDWSLYLNNERMDISPLDTPTREHMTIVAEFGTTNDKRGYDEAVFCNISIQNDFSDWMEGVEMVNYVRYDYPSMLNPVLEIESLIPKKLDVYTDASSFQRDDRSPSGWKLVDDMGIYMGMTHDEDSLASQIFIDIWYEDSEKVRTTDEQVDIRMGMMQLATMRETIGLGVEDMKMVLNGDIDDEIYMDSMLVSAGMSNPFEVDLEKFIERSIGTILGSIFSSSNNAIVLPALPIEHKIQVVVDDVDEFSTTFCDINSVEPSKYLNGDVVSACPQYFTQLDWMFTLHDSGSGAGSSGTSVTGSTSPPYLTGTLSTFTESTIHSGKYNIHRCKFETQSNQRSWRKAGKVGGIQMVYTKFTNIEGNSNATTKKAIQMIYKADPGFTGTVRIRVKITDSNFLGAAKDENGHTNTTALKEHRQEHIHRMYIPIMVDLEGNSIRLSSTDVYNLMNQIESPVDNNATYYEFTSYFDHGNLGVSADDILRIRTEIQYSDIVGRLHIADCLKVVRKDIKQMRQRKSDL